VGAPPFEVLVVDNGSSDDSVAVARSAAVQPVVLAESRRGSYAARNAGITAARGARLAFTDADCVPTPDWVARGSAAAGPVVGGDVRMTPSARPTVWERYDRALYLRQESLVQQGFAATANLWVDRTAMERVGPFDPALRSSGDLEWGRRAGRAGLSVVYAADVAVEHAPRTTATQTWRLHRRLGAGWAALAARGEWPPVSRDTALRLPLGMAVDAVAADGPPLRRRQLAPVHALAMAARVTGRLTGH
jgi:glycosyltransferase involved in cell wall biosynthesis